MASAGKPFLKIILTLVVLAGFAFGGYWYYQNHNKDQQPEYTTVPFARGEITQAITATGQLDAVLSVDVGSQISGQITKLYADFNTPVKKDQVIVEIDPATYQQKLADLRNQKLGFVFQGFNLLARTTARENVELPMLYGRCRFQARELHERAMHSLDVVGLAQRADHYPSQLSGGQQQRVAIARALINQPQILLADEPTGNLDSKTSVEIMGVFQKLNEQGITIVMVTHELDIAQYCKRNLIMRDGRLVSDVRVSPRLNAVEEMKRILSAEVDAKLTG